MFTAALFTIAKTWKQCGCLSINEWIKKIQDRYTVESYSTTRKISLFATTWMNPESTMFNEISKTEKEKCCMISLICGI